MTNRRAIQLAKRVEMWQGRLSHLGVGGHRIEGVTTENDCHEKNSTNASVTPSTDYDSAWFSFSAEFVDDAYDNDDFWRLDITIIHEWVHVAFRDYYRAIQMTEGHVAPALQEAQDDMLEHTNERLVEGIARQIYHAYRENVVL